MSSAEPPDEPSPFEGWPMLGDIARLFSSQGPVNWDVARQTAQWISTEGRAEPNVDPVERVRMEELARVADLNVTQATGLSTSVTGGVLSVLPVTRGQWAQHTLDAYRPYLEGLAESLAQTPDDTPIGDAATQLLGDLGKVLGPVLLGVQSGYMVGYLARRAFGQYDLLVPRPPADQILVVPANLDGFAREWSIEPDEVRMWVCLNEVVRHSVLGLHQVRARLDSLLHDYVSRFEVNPDAFEARLSEMDPTDPAALQAVMGNPETLLGAVQTEGQREVLSRIEDLSAVVCGFVDHVLDEVGRRLIGSYGMITEAMHRRRVEATDGERFAQRLLGLSLSAAQYERGGEFVRGVVDRAGDEGLQRLWRSDRELPTPAEIDAPGLWLARIDLPE